MWSEISLNNALSFMLCQMFLSELSSMTELNQVVCSWAGISENKILTCPKDILTIETE